MGTIEVVVKLPRTLADEARSVGLLDPEALAALLREELRRRREERLCEAADRLAVLPGAPLSTGEIESEIASARAARRNLDARRG